MLPVKTNEKFTNSKNNMQHKKLNVKNSFKINKKQTHINFQQYKEQIKVCMRNAGASEEFINSEVTGLVILMALKNNFKPENVAWALLQ